jgi:hypothetical protein
MALQIEQQTRDIGTVRTTLGPERTRVIVRPGDAFRFIDDAGQPIVRAPRLRVRRLDNNLIIDGLPDGREVELNNFFGACRPGAECTVSLAGIGLPGAAVITEDSPPTAALQDGSFLLYSDNTDSVALAALPAAKVVDAAGPSWLAIGGAAAGIGIAAAAAGGGGGGGGGPVEDTTPPGAPVITSGPVLRRAAALVTGEAEAGARVTLRVDVNGNGVFTDAGDLTFVTTADGQGRWSVDLNGAPTSGTPPAGGLVEGRAYTLLVQASDAAQNASAATRSAVTLDGTPPAAPVIGVVAGDDVINAAEVAAGVIVGGTAEAGSTVAVSIGGATANATAGANGAWSATFAPSQLPATGLATITATAIDAVGNSSAASTRQVLLETVAPGGPVITDNAPGTATGPVTFTFTFERAITGFTASDVLVTGGTPGAFAQVSPTVYTLVVTPVAATQAGQIVLSVPAGAGADPAGNPTGAGAAIQAYDTAPPSVAITNNAPAVATGAVTFTFTFSEAVTGFDVTDITVAGGSLVASSFSGSGSTYVAQYLPTAGTSGTMTVGVAANVAVDAVSLPNTAAPSSAVTYDRLAPTLVSITDSIPETAGPAGVSFTFTFSEAVTGFDLADITFTGGQAGDVLSAFTPVSQTVYTATYVPSVAGASGTATVTVGPGATITDSAGNAYASTLSASQAYERVAPTVVSITDPVTGTANGPVTFTFTFSEPINPATFVAGDILLSPGAVAGTVAAVGGSGNTAFTSTITPPSGSGTYTVSLPAGAVTDVAGNPSTASSTVSQAYAPLDVTPPSVVITDNREAPGITVLNLANPTVTFTFSFSEPIQTGTSGEAFIFSDLAPISGAGNGTFGALTFVDAQTYTLQYTASALDAPGSVGITLGASRYADLGGLFNTASASRTQAYDLQAPTVVITDSFTSTTIPTNAPVTFTFTTSEATTDFTLADIAVTNGTAAPTLGGSGSVYTLVVTPTPNSSGTLRVDVVADAFRDAAGNPSVAANGQQSFDTQAPTQSVTAAQLFADVPVANTPVAPGDPSTDPTPRLTISLDAVLAIDETLQLFRDGGVTVVGSFIGGSPATSFTYTEATTLGAGAHSYSAQIIDSAGNIRALDLVVGAGGAADPYTFTI